MHALCMQPLTLILCEVIFRQNVDVGTAPFLISKDPEIAIMEVDTSDLEKKSSFYTRLHTCSLGPMT
jgi:hypothetical protein